MALRTITTPDGREWTVWNTEPSPDKGGDRMYLPEALAKGWLTFQCAEERRRIIPVPEGWDELPDSELIALWRSADRVADAERRLQ